MPRDAKVIADTAEWMAIAAEDLRAANHLLSDDPPLIKAALFHLQQAAEKALKGFLVWHGVSFRKTHSLEEIGESCREIDPALFPMIYRTLPLTEYATAVRYPGPVEIPDLAGAREWLGIVRAVLAAVEERAVDP